jgi:glycosyltransferase involved in cell wall biosynthesis
VVGLLSELDPARHGIERVHLWTFRSLADAVPDRPWLVKHCPAALERSLPQQLAWQALSLKRELIRHGCDVLFTTDASTLCRFEPMVVLSQDMLSYEPGVMQTYGWGRARLRLHTILKLQNSAFRRAAGVIFLTKYAGEVIQRSCGPLLRVAFVPHGIPPGFFEIDRARPWPTSDLRPIECVYVSNAALYKHQWEVIKAVAKLRSEGLNLNLTLIGGGHGRAQELIDQERKRLDPEGTFVRQLPFVPNSDLLVHLSNADVFVFASACENMPVTLLEAMAAGLPVACSNRGPMPEVLGDAGTYFDPVDPQSIANALRYLVTNAELRGINARRSREIAKDYSWARTSYETMDFISDIVNGVHTRARASP